MKSHTIIIAALATSLAACTPKTETKQDKDMNTLTFNKEQAAAMAAIACNEAKADYAALAKAINEGMDAGLTVSQTKEALSQLYAYTGFPRSLNALGTLQKVIAERDAKGLKTEIGEDASPLPSNYDALAQGTEVQMLICVSGRGWYQEWGKEPIELKPGVVIAVPEGVKHWHGAAADSWMQHLRSMIIQLPSSVS